MRDLFTLSDLRLPLALWLLVALLATAQRVGWRRIVHTLTRKGS